LKGLEDAASCCEVIVKFDELREHGSGMRKRISKENERKRWIEGPADSFECLNLNYEIKKRRRGG